MLLFSDIGVWLDKTLRIIDIFTATIMSELTHDSVNTYTLQYKHTNNVMNYLHKFWKVLFSNKITKNSCFPLLYLHRWCGRYFIILALDFKVLRFKTQNEQILLSISQRVSFHFFYIFAIRHISVYPLIEGILSG